MPANLQLIQELATTYHRLNTENEIDFPGLMAVTLAQWMLESGRGQSRLAREHFNFAGLKFRDEMSGRDAQGDDRGAARPVNYTAHDGRDEYCAFSSLENFIFGYWRFIRRSPYAGFEKYAVDPEGYLRFLKRCGYAADPNYVNKVLDLIPEAEELLRSTAAEGGVSGGRRSLSESRRLGGRRRGASRVREDAIYLYSGADGRVEEWEGAEVMGEAETGGDLDRLLDFLDTTQVNDFVLLPGDQENASRHEGRRSRRRVLADGVYFFDGPEGLVEEWLDGELVEETETNQDVDALLEFLDGTEALDYFIEVSAAGRRRGGRRGHGRISGRVRRSEEPLVPMDEDDEADRVQGDLQGLRVALDVGHGYTAKGVKDPGAVNQSAGISEHDLNIIVAQTAADELRSRGAEVSVFLYDNPSEKLTLVQKGRRAQGFDIFVSCHHNSVDSPSVQRTETLVGKKHNTPQDYELAEVVQASMVSALRLKGAQVKPRGLSILTGAGGGVKAKCLIEPYFISERSLTLSKAEGMSRVAGEALARGVANYWLKG